MWWAFMAMSIDQLKDMPTSTSSIGAGGFAVDRTSRPHLTSQSQAKDLRMSELLSRTCAIDTSVVVRPATFTV